MGKIGTKFSHLLTVKAGGADPPPLYGQPDRKKTVFFLTTSLTIVTHTDGQTEVRVNSQLIHKHLLNQGNTFFIKLAYFPDKCWLPCDNTF